MQPVDAKLLNKSEKHRILRLDHVFMVEQGDAILELLLFSHAISYEGVCQQTDLLCIIGKVLNAISVTHIPNESPVIHHLSTSAIFKKQTRGYLQGRKLRVLGTRLRETLL